jgi:hypothetical protein
MVFGRFARGGGGRLKQLVERDWQFANAFASGVVDSIGDRRGDTKKRELGDSLCEAG